MTTEILTKTEFCKKYRIGREEFRRLYRTDPEFWGFWVKTGPGQKKTCRAADAEAWYLSRVNRCNPKA